MTDPLETGTGELILVATPIGNLGDLSARAEETLRTADAIACEDTRHTLKLLSAKGITGKRLLAVHEHNEMNAAAGIVALVERGDRVALVTDAGTPGISDPGERVVAAVAAAGLPISAVPGPSAVVMALSLSGLRTERFVFDGFLPTKASSRRTALAELAKQERTVVLYEAPHRLLSLLTELSEACGPERRIAVCKELTKRFERVIRGTIAQVQSEIAEPQGEYVVVIEGAAPAVAGTVDGHEEEIRRDVAILRAQGTSLKDASVAVAATLGVSRKQVYDLCVAKDHDSRFAPQ
jgi:16S rRNA (cytidine1402-2'-O)-methyltransferase